MPASVRRLLTVLLCVPTALLAFVYATGYLAAPSRHPTLASVRLGEPGNETKLSGSRFECTWDAAQSAQRCAGSLEEATLVLTFSTRACSARLGERLLACRLDYGVVPGLPSVRVQMHRLHARSPSVAALVDYIGTLSECEWGRLSQLTLLVMLGWVVLAVRRHVSSTPMRWVYVACALLSYPVLLLALFFWHVHMGYAD